MITLLIEFSAGISGCDRPVARIIQMSFMSIADTTPRLPPVAVAVAPADTAPKPEPAPAPITGCEPFPAFVEVADEVGFMVKGKGNNIGYPFPSCRSC
jgi:hypothetical protein